MSATLGIMLRQLMPEWSIQIIEALPKVAQESSNEWNNAGTGHAALCELNYTPQSTDGSIDITKAIRINERFETSKHFWSYLVEQNIITNPAEFIRTVPHMSFVQGTENQDFLKQRHTTMVQHPLFDTMEYTTDHGQIREWAPLLLQGRPTGAPLAATRVRGGTDVSFGAITRRLYEFLNRQEGVGLALETRVENLERERDGFWRVVLRNKAGRQSLRARFVFIGAGGGALPLLQKSGIPEGKGYGGFPVSGHFLISTNPEIAERHTAKVYGKAAVGAPPMSVPHLDSRMINNHKSLLFGPYAGFSPKYLKTGSNLDLLSSVRPDNLLPMLAAGRDNLDLTRYLINECRKKHDDRCSSLREFFPDARNEEWKLITAGQRVQIIKRDKKRTGRLQFGTEVVAAHDGSLASVLGASPGASTTVSIILEVLEKCFPKPMNSTDWKEKLAQMVPAYGLRLAENETLFRTLSSRSNDRLQLG